MNIEQQRQRHEEMDAERDHDAEEEERKRPECLQSGIRDRLGDEREDPDGREAHHQLGDLHHHLEDAVPEVELGFGIVAVQAGDEEAVEQTEEDQSEHLPRRGSRDDVGRHHAQKDLDDVAGALVGELRLELALARRSARRPPRPTPRRRPAE
jgi:hypothetical protein